MTFHYECLRHMSKTKLAEACQMQDMVGMAMVAVRDGRSKGAEEALLQNMCRMDETVGMMKALQQGDTSAPAVQEKLEKLRTMLDKEWRNAIYFTGEVYSRSWHCLQITYAAPQGSDAFFLDAVTKH